MHISLEEAIQAIRKGKVIAIPTETVYGLAASLDHSAALEQIFALKKRPLLNPLIVHISAMEQIDSCISEYPPHFDKIATTFWPGPLTCILPVNEGIPPIVRAGLRTVGVRMPALSLTRQLIQEVGPLAMPSANLSGKPSATKIEHIEEDFGLDFPILKGGTGIKGLESTVIFYREGQWSIIRQGALSQEAFAPVLGYIPSIAVKDKETILCPGQLFRHYAPLAKLFISSQDREDCSCILGFIEKNYPLGKTVFFLGSLHDPVKVAESLYETLRRLDREGIKKAWIDTDFPQEGLWRTIRERILRAAATEDSK